MLSHEVTKCQSFSDLINNLKVQENYQFGLKSKPKIFEDLKLGRICEFCCSEAWLQ